MFTQFFLTLREARVPVSLMEYLALMEGMRAQIPCYDVEMFYYFARAALVKDERHLDRFDQVFGHCFRGLDAVSGVPEDAGAAPRELPEEWLRRLAERVLTEEEKATVEALGGFEKLMETLRQRLAEQHQRHQGGSKMIGTAGTSPFGAYGYNPEGVRIGQHESRHRRAVKVWDRREFKNLAGDVALGTRNIKIALRRLRRFARTGAATELDLNGTIGATARNGGLLDLQLVPERHNAVKLLLLLDVGGSMEDHVRSSAELFSAARAEFKHLEFFYFHNCVYEKVWRDNRRRHDETVTTWDVINTYGADWRLVIVGDATMSPYEIEAPGGSVEHWNEEPGEIWMRRLLSHFHRAAWLNPQPVSRWSYYYSLQHLRKIMEGRMFPLTLNGIDGAMRALS